MSQLETVRRAEFEDMCEPGRHTLIIAQPRAGKTSFLLYCTALFSWMGETVIVRDIGEFYEWFSLLDDFKYQGEHYPGFKILGHVPKNCRVHFEHRNFEQVEFDVRKINTLFDNFVRDRINLVFFETFCIEVLNHVRWWSTFFKKLLPWKQRPGHGQLPFTLVCDEFGDLAPGKGRTYLPGQNQISQLIAVNHRKFRRHRIRLVAAVHFFRDITPPIRQRFDCYCIKKNYPNENEVPFSVRQYAAKFRFLEINELIFIDSAKAFTQFKIDELVPPRRFYNISVTGNVDKQMRAKKINPWEKRAKKWRGRALDAGETAVELGFPPTSLAKLWKISERSLRRHRASHRQRQRKLAFGSQ